MNAPFLVAVNGIAAGAGFSMAICGDMVFAAESAKFTMAYTRAGLSPDGGASYLLPRLVGLRRATSHKALIPAQPLPARTRFKPCSTRIRLT